MLARVSGQATNRWATLACAGLLALMAAGVWEFAKVWSTPADGASLLPDRFPMEWAAAVLAAIAAGRIVLSFLPPGPIGSHRVRDLPLTLAVSWLLGAPLLQIQAQWFPGASVWVSALPWAVLLGLRRATLPGTMVPRHAVREEAPSAAARRLRASAFVWAAAIMLLAIRRDAAELGTWLVFVIVADHAWEQARRAPAGRTWLLVTAAFCAPFLAGHAVESHATIASFGAGTCMLIPWIRRADRRACWLAAFFFAACAAQSPALAVGGLGVLLFASTREQRPDATRACIAAACIVALPTALFGSSGPGGSGVLGEQALGGTADFYLETAGMVALLLTARVLLTLAKTEATRTRASLIVLVALGALTAAFGNIDLAWLPLALLITGIVAIRPDTHSLSTRSD